MEQVFALTNFKDIKTSKTKELKREPEDLTEEDIPDWLK
jgi:hypothetical protein